MFYYSAQASFIEIVHKGKKITEIPLSLAHANYKVYEQI